jgi:gamma-glutamyltranspeptidase / glutathione hydrolase
MAFPLAPFSPTHGLRGMVAAADGLASSAGVAALAQGGSAADAAVATAAVMAVTSPHLCGLGGDLLAMVSAPGSDPQALLAVGRAGSGVSAGRIRAEGRTVMPIRGDARTVPVPGAVDGWLALHGRFGRLPLDQVLGPAIELAVEGFTASLLLALASHLVFEVPGAAELCPNGPIGQGQPIRLPGVARTLLALVADGRDGFYQGEFGRALLDLGDGVYAPEDLASSNAEWCEPARLRVWEHDLWTVPPPSQGYLTLAGSWIAERGGLGSDPSDPSWPHVAVEASRAAGHDRPHVLFDGADWRALLAAERLDAAAARVHDDWACPPDVAIVSEHASAPTARLGDGDTTHICAIDGDGLGISLTQSNALDFGSHLVAGSTGIFLHNRGLGFNLLADHPAEVGPGRRPPHTLSPMLATTVDGSLSHLVGAMGGDVQPQILLQLMARMLRGGEDPATAIAAPRFGLDSQTAGPFRLWWGNDLAVRIEAHAPPSWADGLARRGHSVQAISAFDPVAVGCAQIISVARDEGGGFQHFTGASDPRSPEGATSAR